MGVLATTAMFLRPDRAARGPPPPRSYTDEAHLVIVSCERGKRVLKGSSPAMHYALKHLPTIVREYTDCEDRIRRALNKSQAERRRSRSHRRR